MRVLLIDGSSCLYRSFFALPRLTTASGLPVHAVYGFATLMFKLLREERPTHLAVALDGGSEERRRSYASYKAHRPAMPHDLTLQFPLLLRLFEVMRVPLLRLPGQEADDVIATLVERLPPEAQVVIVTADKDLQQLLRPGVEILDPRGRRIDRDSFRRQRGIDPERLPEVLALSGDPVDGIPGVPGIGPRTALELVRAHGSVEGVLGRLQELALPPAKKRALRDYGQQALLYRDLIRLRADLPLRVDLEALRRQEPDWDELERLLRELEFTSLLRQLPPRDRAPLRRAIPAELPSGGVRLAICPRPEGVALFWGEGEPALLPWSEAPAVWGRLEPLEKIGHDLKGVALELARRDLRLGPACFDLEVASLLLYPQRRDHSLGFLALERLGRRRAEVQECYELWPLLRQELAEAGLLALFEGVEMPLLEPLVRLEARGIWVDPMALREVEDRERERLRSLERRMWELAGRPFNPASSQQTTQALRGMGLRLERSDARTLERLGDHPLVRLVLEHRRMERRLRAALSALRAAIGPDGRLRPRVRRTWGWPRLEPDPLEALPEALQAMAAPPGRCLVRVRWVDLGRRASSGSLLANALRGRGLGEQEVREACAAEVVKRDLVRLHRRLQGEGREGGVAFWRGEELLLEVPDRELEPVLHLVLEEMGQAAVEVRWGRSWKELSPSD